jgi:hypothetical protein
MLRKNIQIEGIFTGQFNSKSLSIFLSTSRIRDNGKKIADNETYLVEVSSQQFSHINIGSVYSIVGSFHMCDDCKMNIVPKDITLIEKKIAYE